MERVESSPFSLVESIEAPSMMVPRLRFTVKTIMVAVAIVSVPLAVASVRARRAAYLVRRDYHVRQANQYRILVHSSARGALEYRAGRARDPRASAAILEGQVRRYTPLARYHEAMSRKYEHALARPWVIVPSDPPEPQAWPGHPNPAAKARPGDAATPRLVTFPEGGR